MLLNILFPFIAGCRSSCASPSRCWWPNISYQYLTSTNTRTAKFCRLQSVWGICCIRCKQGRRWWNWNTLRSLAGEWKWRCWQLFSTTNSYMILLRPPSGFWTSGDFMLLQSTGRKQLYYALQCFFSNYLALRQKTLFSSQFLIVPQEDFLLRWK